MLPAMDVGDFDPHPEYEIKEGTGCWLWTGSLYPSGYGEKFDRNHDHCRRAHMVYFERYRGPIPTGLILHHLCANIRCVNPWHLLPMTTGENVRQKKNAKVDHRMARSIRDEYAKGAVSQKYLAKKHSLSQSHISRIVSRKRWDSEVIR